MHMGKMMGVNSHRGLWAEATGSADAVALDTSVAVSLTHRLHMEL